MNLFGLLFSQTRVYCFFGRANLTLDLAAPVEGTGASFDYNDLLRLVTPAATHEITTVDADARVVALSTVGPEYTELWIFLTKRRRWLEINEIF